MVRCLLALLLLLPAPALAQAVRGTVFDSSGSRLAATNIRVRDRAGRVLFTAVSSANGEFDLPIQGGDSVRLEFERVGYAARTSELLSPQPGEVLDLEVHLTESAVSLQPITVVATRSGNPKLVDFYERASRNRRLGLGQIWTRADLDLRKPLSRLLSTVDKRSSCTQNEVFIDGVPLSTESAPDVWARLHPAPVAVQELAHLEAHMEAPVPREVGSDEVDWLVSPEDVEGIEVYRDAEIPVQFNPTGDLCRVTLIWRKSFHMDPPNYGVARRAIAVLALSAAIGVLLSLTR